jgi:hypothetical protein
MGLVLLTASLSTVNHLLSYRSEVKNLSGPTYLSTDQIATMDWMSQKIPKDALILASYPTGNYIPRLAGQRVFVGEDMLTNELQARQRDLQLFYSPDWDDAKRVGLLRRFHVGYLFYGPEEHKLGPFDPKSASFLSRIYEKGGFQVYEVRSETAPGVRAAAPAPSGGGMP